MAADADPARKPRAPSRPPTAAEVDKACRLRCPPPPPKPAWRELSQPPAPAVPYTPGCGPLAPPFRHWPAGDMPPAKPTQPRVPQVIPPPAERTQPRVPQVIPAKFPMPPQPKTHKFTQSEAPQPRNVQPAPPPPPCPPAARRSRSTDAAGDTRNCTMLFVNISHR
jgi:hypothetical protein